MSARLTRGAMSRLFDKLEALPVINKAVLDEPLKATLLG